jgi:hypothetical protein
LLVVFCVFKSSSAQALTGKRYVGLLGVSYRRRTAKLSAVVYVLFSSLAELWPPIAILPSGLTPGMIVADLEDKARVESTPTHVRTILIAFCSVFTCGLSNLAHSSASKPGHTMVRSRSRFRARFAGYLRFVPTTAEYSSRPHPLLAPRHCPPPVGPTVISLVNKLAVASDTPAIVRTATKLTKS